MANPFPLQTQFTGMWRDSSRDQLPNGKLWMCSDFIPEQLGAPLRKRGGVGLIGTNFGVAASTLAVAYCPFTAGEKYVAVASDGNAYQFVIGVSTSLGAAFTTPGDLVFHRTGAPSLGTLIITDRTGAAAPKSWDRTTYGNLGGTPPLARYGTVWNDRVLLANGTVGGTASPSRVWFGIAGNSASAWDTAASWQDTATDVTGITTVGSSILVFHGRSTEIIRGTTPPLTAGAVVGDLTLSRAFDVGCIDNRSIVRYNDTVIFADTRGVYQTDGATLKDLTFVGGMRNFWRDQMLPYLTTWAITTGVINDTLIVSITDGTSAVECIAYDLQRGFWWRFSGVAAMGMARVGSTFEETYAAIRGTNAVVALSGIFNPTSANKTDGHTAIGIGAYLETPGYHGYMRMNRRWLPSHGIQNWKNLYVNYDLRAAAGQFLIVRYSTDLGVGVNSYTDLLPTFAPVTKATRARRSLNVNGNWLCLKIGTQITADDERLYAIEADYSPRETSRLS